MTPELIGIITVGIALAALNFTMFNMINKRLERLEDRISNLENRVSGLEAHVASLGNRVSGLENRVSDMDRRLARLEGLIDGIRESLFDRVRPEV